MQNGELSHQLGFIIKGALRTFTINQEGEDISFLLQVDSDFFGDYECFLSGAKSNWQLQTTTRTEVVLIEKQHLHFLMQRDPFGLVSISKLRIYAFWKLNAGLKSFYSTRTNNAT